VGWVPSPPSSMALSSSSSSSCRAAILRTRIARRELRSYREYALLEREGVGEGEGERRSWEINCPGRSGREAASVSTRGAVAVRAARDSLIAARYEIIVHIALSSGVIAARDVYANYEARHRRNVSESRERIAAAARCRSRVAAHAHADHQGQGRSRSVRGASTSSGKPRRGGRPFLRTVQTEEARLKPLTHVNTSTNRER